MTRLKKIASIEDLGEMNMTSDLINQNLYTSGEDISAESVVYRRLMNNNTKFIVEMWKMSDNTFGVFSGKFNGMWTIDSIEANGNFADESSAESYIQTNLQGQAEYNETVMIQSRLKKTFRTLHAAGKEPDYQEIADGFASQVDIKIPEVEEGHKSSLNKYYDDFVDYMTKYYPEWAKYPAFIWGGWGYFTDNYKNEEQPEEPKEEPKEETQEEVVQEVEQPEVNTTDVGTGMDTGGGDSN